MEIYCKMNKNELECYFEYLKEHYTSEEYYNQFLLEKIPAGSKILDLGCGLGLLLKKLSQIDRTYRLFGVDINPYCVEHTKKNCPNSNVVCISEDDYILPFQNHEFDYVFCLDVIEHVAEPSFMLSEVNRILKDGGKLVLCTPDRFSKILDRRFGISILKLILFNIERILCLQKIDPTHTKEFWILEFKNIIVKTGFRIKNINGFYKRVIPFHPHGSIIALLERRST